MSMIEKKQGVFQRHAQSMFDLMKGNDNMHPR